MNILEITPPSNSNHSRDSTLLPAPSDSTFAPEKFVLGTEGLRAAIAQIVNSSRGSLYALGTWHNHLGDFGPSLLDMQTALGLALKQFFPVLMLIAKPEGYTCLTAETFDADLLATSSDPLDGSLMKRIPRKCARDDG